MGLVGRTLSLDVILKILETLPLFEVLLTVLNPAEPIPAHLFSKVSDREEGDFYILFRLKLDIDLRLRRPTRVLQDATA